MSGQARRRRHSRAVYRRRRVVVLIGILLVAAAVVWLVVAQPWRGAADASPRQPSRPAASPAPGPSQTPEGEQTPMAEETDAVPSDVVDPSATPDPEPTDSIKPCLGGELLVEALTDADTYRSGQNPQLSIRLTNRGAKDCTINVGTTSQRFTIMSGGDTWWRSTDCQSEPVDMVVTLAAGQAVTSATPLAWDRTRSNVSTCGDSTRPRAPAGGASYHLTVEIGGVESMGSKQFLLY